MKEAAFVKQNKARWERFEKVVKDQQNAQPDELAAFFIQITDDLSFATTKYPDSRTTRYLNALAGKLHLGIYKNKREDKNRFVTFWTHEVPACLYETRKHLLYAFTIFIIAGTIGVVSTIYDDTFVRLILGDGYVNMTLENIKNGTPMGVYGSMSQTTMFFMITWNNIMVAFRVFIYGIFASVGTGFYLFYNALMVGTFLTFFYQEDSLSHAVPVIMLHGTIELLSIVVAAAAGFVLGNSLIFPGTFSRLESFKRGAMKGLKIVVGLVPFFIIAGFIESYITRYEFMHWSLKAIIILSSAALMVFYFVIYPYLLKRNGKLYTD
jgi:uncharacterized membrane protein SpoIIM required for sporulation